MGRAFSVRWNTLFDADIILVMKLDRPERVERTTARLTHLWSTDRKAASLPSVGDPFWHMHHACIIWVEKPTDCILNSSVQGQLEW